MDFLPYLQSSREDYPRISDSSATSAVRCGRLRDASADKKILEGRDWGDDFRETEIIFRLNRPRLDRAHY